MIQFPKRNFSFLTCLFFLVLQFNNLSAQRRGLPVPPVQGHTTSQSIDVWLLIERSSQVQAWLTGPEDFQSSILEFDLSKREEWRGYGPITCKFDQLPQPNSEYRLHLKFDGEVWQEQYPLKTFPAPGIQDFSFLTGSCAFIGTQPLQTVARLPYTSVIFDAMTKIPSDFSLWLGDNVYYINGEWSNRRRRSLKNIRCRLDPRLSRFLSSRPNYAAWDDHDFGPNDSDSRFKEKEGSLQSFLEYWPLPETGLAETPGLFYKMTFQDADFFVLDNRFYRLDSAHQQMIGPDQMKWLKQSLKASQATFKFIVNGGQVLNDLTSFSWYHFKEERAALFDFVLENKIEGILFLSGDRHFSELEKEDRGEGNYPFYDFTCSPLTAWVRTVAGRDQEATNPKRVAGTQVLERNFGKVSISGPAGSRLCKFETFNEGGILLWDFEIGERDLQHK